MLCGTLELLSGEIFNRTVRGNEKDHTYFRRLAQTGNIYAWVAGIMREIRKRDLDIALYQYNSYGNWSKDALHNIGEYNIYNLPDFSEYDGVILDCSNISDQKQKRKIINKLHETGLPVVSIEFEEEEFHCISIDNYGPIIELMHHMYEKHDCRRFVFAGGSKNAFGNRRRARAYKQCIEQFG